MKRYDKYKPSGIDWIGEIPEHWKMMKIKFYCHSISSGATPNTNNSAFWNGDIPWVPSGCCHDCAINEAPKFITEDGLNSCSTQIIPAGTTVMAMTGATCSLVGYLTINAATNQSVMSYVENKKVANSKFLFYLLMGAREYVLTHQTGGAQAGIDGQDCSNLIVPLVSLNEQNSIANFLDEKCAIVDGSIENQNNYIALLEELKINTIKKAVYQGLDNNVAKVYSGLERIGNVPSHWTIDKVSRVFNYNSIGSGTTPTSSIAAYYDEAGHYWLQTGDLNDGIISDTSKKLSDFAMKDYNLKVYPKGSIVIAMYGATIGKIGLLDIDTSTNQACCVLPPSKKCSPNYAYYYFLTAKESFINEATGGGQPNISQDVIRRHLMPIPPQEEQDQIVKYLNEVIKPINHTIEVAEEKMKMLKMYKQTLIYESVTGKRKI